MKQLNPDLDPIKEKAADITKEIICSQEPKYGIGHETGERAANMFNVLFDAILKKLTE